MTQMDALRQDHAVLRAKAALLESALAAIPHTRLVFREKCFSLVRLLNRHMQREAPLLQLYHARMSSGRDVLRAEDHAGEHAHLRAVTELLLGGIKMSLPLLIMRVSEALEQLQAQMEAQEQMIFPLIDTLAPPTISGEMSVNAILQCYPQTEPVFTRLRINRLAEGYESVEELAWRRGLRVSELVKQLEQAAAFPGY